MTIASAVGKFYGARDAASVWPMLCVHLNITLYALTYWITRPVQPFLFKNLGADAVMFGYLQTTFSVVQLAGSPIIGRLCDTQGSKLALQMCQVATGLSYILLGTASNIPLLFLAQMPTVLMQSMHCAQAFVSEFSSEESRSSALGRLSLSYGFGMAAGPLLGGYLSNLVGVQNVAVLAGCIMFIPIYFNAVLLPGRIAASDKDSADKPSGLRLTEILHVMEDKTCRQLTIFMLLTGLAAQIYHSSFAMAASTTFGLSPSDLGQLQTLSGILGLVANTFVVGAVEKRLSQLSTISLATAILGSTLLMYSQASTYVHLMIIALVSAMPSMAMYTTVTSMLTKAAAKDNTATIIGLGHATRSFCGIAAPTLGGFIMQSYGTHGIGLTGAAIMALAFAYIQIARPSPSKDKAAKSQ